MEKKLNLDALLSEDSTNGENGQKEHKENPDIKIVTEQPQSIIEDEGETNTKISLNHIKEKFVPKIEKKEIIEDKQEIILEAEPKEEEIFKNYESDFSDLNFKTDEGSPKEKEKNIYKKHPLQKKALFGGIIAFCMIGLLILGLYLFLTKKTETPITEDTVIKEEPINEEDNNEIPKKDIQPPEKVYPIENIIEKVFSGYTYKIIEQEREDGTKSYIYEKNSYTTLEELEKKLEKEAKKAWLIHRNLEVKQILIERYNNKK